MASRPRISVVIPTRHRDDALAECLDRLAPGAQTLGAADYEVIVTDDGSTSTAEAMIRERFPWCRWTQGPRRGPAANRNHGAHQGTGDHVVFFDDDCLPESTVLAAYMAAFDRGVQVAEGAIKADRPRTRLDEEAPENHHGGIFWSCNIGLAAAVFRESGGFDERFPFAAMEDVELRERLRKRGFTSAFLSDALVVHPLRRKAGWQFVRRRAASHAVYYRLPTCHLPAPSYLSATMLVARIWLKFILPGVVQYRGRGLWLAAVHSVGPWINVWEMKKVTGKPMQPAWPVQAK